MEGKRAGGREGCRGRGLAHVSYHNDANLVMFCQLLGQFSMDFIKTTHRDHGLT